MKRSKGKFPNYYRGATFIRNCYKCKGKGSYTIWRGMWKEEIVKCDVCAGKGKLG